jgi:hypothetical protein
MSSISYKERGRKLRDPKRIKPLMAELEALWEEMPDHRFCQMIYQIVAPLLRDDPIEKKYKRALFSIEDDEFINAFLLYKAIIEKAKSGA